MCIRDRVWEAPQGSRGSRGRPIVNMFPLAEGEKINVVLPLTGENRSFPATHYVFMATSMGTVKKTALDEFSNPRKAGIIAVDLDEGDYLITWEGANPGPPGHGSGQHERATLTERTLTLGADNVASTHHDIELDRFGGMCKDTGEMVAGFVL